MIKSRNYTFGFFLVVGAVLFFSVLLIACISQYQFHFVLLKIDIRSQRSYYGWLVVSSIPVLVFGSILWRKGNIIYIKNENGIKIIIFKNFITRKLTEYFFAELDGYITTKIAHDRTFTRYKTVCLVKNDIIIKKIDSFYYSNYSEMVNGLSGLSFWDTGK